LVVGMDAPLSLHLGKGDYYKVMRHGTKTQYPTVTVRNRDALF
jgi:hypothetical protein